MTLPPKDGEPARRSLDYGLMLLLLAALWMAARPYYGIVRDARLYMAQALYRLEPEKFQGDLFFRYGSQDSFSLFSAVFAPVVQMLGPGWAHLVFSVLGQIFWLAGLFALVIALFGRGRSALAAAVGAIILMSDFGLGVFRYSEIFVTPRIFAEATVMLALACALRRRPVLSVVVALAAIPIHPLIALPGVLVVLLMAVPITLRTVAAAGVGLAVFAGLALFGIDPFSRLLVRLDPEWYGLVHERIPLAFVLQWGWKGVFLTAVPASLLALVCRAASVQHRRLILSVVAVAGCGVLVTAVFGDLLANLLVLNMQLWRGLWLVTLIANVFAAQAVLSLPQGSYARVFLIVALVANVCENVNGWFPFSSATLALCALAAFAIESRSNRPLPFYLRLPLALFALGAVLFLLTEFAFLLPWGTEPFAALSKGALILSVFLAIGLLLVRKVWQGRRRGIAMVLSAVPFVMAVAFVDQRSDWMKYVLDGAPPDPEIQQIIQGRQTYWEGGLDMLWYKLREPSFYSCDQGAGMMFYRETAMEYQRRSEVLSTLNTREFVEKAFGLCHQKADPKAVGPTTLDQLIYVCRELPELELMVLETGVAGAPRRTWLSNAGYPAAGMTGSGAGNGDEAVSYFIYDCTELLQGG